MHSLYGKLSKSIAPVCSRTICMSRGNKFKSMTVPEAAVSPKLKAILDGNKRWVEEKKDEDPFFFHKLAQPQKPKYLYFGCSDSRVPANEILGLPPGTVFIHRNIGNMVPGNDLNALSVLEYAINHLGVTDIMVTGHYDCGAVRAATKRQDLGLLENWLRQIRDVYRLHRENLDRITDDEVKHYSLVEFNVIEQCLNLFKTGPVQRKRFEVYEQLKAASPSGAVDKEEVYPRIHGLVFNPADGVLKNLPVDFTRHIGPLDHIYSLIPKNTHPTSPLAANADVSNDQGSATSENTYILNK